MLRDGEWKKSWFAVCAADVAAADVVADVVATDVLAAVVDVSLGGEVEVNVAAGVDVDAVMVLVTVELPQALRAAPRTKTSNRPRKGFTWGGS
jgi:hypothetical protein